MLNLSNKQNSQHDTKSRFKQYNIQNIQKSNKSLHNLNTNLPKQSFLHLKNQQSTPQKYTNLSQTKFHHDSQFGSNMIIDYQNAKYQGKLINKTVGKKQQKIIKGGLGILMDDQLNFIVSNWKNDQLNGKTLLFNRSKNYLYGKWNQQTKNPSGPLVMRINSLILITKFSDKTGKWAMTQAQKNVILIYDEQTNNLLVLTGKMQQSHTEYKCSKLSSLTVVEFVHFDGTQKVEKDVYKSKNKHRHRQGQNVKEILSFYCQKYAIDIEEDALTLPQYLLQIAIEAQTSCTKSKNFALNVSKNLLADIIVNQNEYMKQSQTYQTKKHKMFQNNCIVYKQLINKAQISKQAFSYFGFLGGLGIKFMNQQKQINSAKDIKFSQSSTIKLKSIGNHNLNFKIQDIGGRFYDNKCIEQGNFKTKSTFTYEDVLFRPSNKLVSIYNKYHKQQTHFINEYFEKSQLSIFKILVNFEAFVNEHVIYVMNECYLETTKFQQKEQKNQLVSSLLTLKNIIQKIDYQQERPSQSKSKRPNYEIQIQRKNKSKSKSKNKQKNQQENKQTLTALKNKNNELKERIKKVKYEIQYEPQTKNENFVILNDEKIISKIKKHLTTQNYQPNISPKNKSKSASKINKNNSASRSKSKSQISYRPKEKKSYIEKQKQKILLKSKTDLNDDSLQRIDGVIIKKVQVLDKRQRQKTQGEKLLQKINGNIGFKQKFNYGIEYHKMHESFKEKMAKSPQKNKYNGRQRIFTDNQLDKQLENSQFSAIDLPVRSITPGVKSRKKQQYRHYIYSNTNRNINNQEQKYQQQKENEQTIRAQILGITLQEYREKINSQRDYQTFMDKKLLEIVDLQDSMLRISRRSQIPVKIDANQTFGIQDIQQIESSRARRDKSISLGVKQRLALKKLQQKYLKDGEKTYNPILYFPQPKQESLTQRRLRILQEFKKLNEKSDQQQKNLVQSQINIRATLSPLNQNNMARENQWIKKTPTEKLRNEANVKRLPIYEQKMSQKVLSPLRMVKDDFSTIEAYPQRSKFLCLKSTKGELKNQLLDSLKLESSMKQKLTKGLNVQNPLESTRNKNTRKYQYYFDK